MTEQHNRRGAARRRAMLDAAFAVFMEKGFERASLAEIIARSGGSRTTLYELFGGKEGLFETVMIDATQRFLESFEEVLRDASLHPADVLTQFGSRFLECILTQDSQSMLRIVLAEGPRFPKVAEAFYRHGPQLVQDCLAGYFDRLRATGKVRFDDPRVAAEAFLGMIAGHMDLRVAAGRPPDAAEVEAHIRQSVLIFLHGIALERPAC